MFLRSFLILAFIITLVSSLIARDYQRLDSTLIKNGCKVVHIKNSTGPWDIYVLEVDLSNPNNQLKVGIANGRAAWIDGLGNTHASKETLGNMVHRRIQKGEDVIGGINADFFNMSNGMQFNVTANYSRISNTGITANPHAAFYVNDKGEPFIGLVTLSQSVSINKKGNYSIDGVNKARNADQLVIYNNRIDQASSGSNQWGLELLLEPLDSGLINGVVNYQVIEKASLVEMKKYNQIILSGHGKVNTFLNNAIQGDLVRIYSEFAGLNKSPIVEMVGGWGHIVKEGQNCSVSSIEEEGTMDHENDRHPRSSVGFNKDKTKLYLVAVDGRSDISKGMNLDELADFMINELDAWEGLNFDGGGSTTLMSGEETVNNPSGGVHRAITNALLVVNEQTETLEKQYDFVTNSTTEVEEGTRLFYEQDEENKAAVWVMEVDRSDEHIHLSQVIANEKIGWYDAFGIAHKNVEVLSEIVETQFKNSENQSIGAINASPFDFRSGAIKGLSMKDGVIAVYSKDDSITPALWFDESNEPFISNLKVNLNVVAENKATLPIDNVNGVRWLDHMTLYNSYIGEKTNTNQWGGEILLSPESDLYINGVNTFKVLEKVTSLESGSGKMPIADGEFVLSGNSKAYDFINDNIEVGQNINIESVVANAGNIQIKDAIAGTSILMIDGEGVKSDDPGFFDNGLILGNELRTAIGYNNDKSKIYLFTSDEFSKDHLGLTPDGLVALMKKYGVKDGLSLGGGNNSTMLTADGLVNKLPDDEVPVANGIVIEYLNLTNISTKSNAVDIIVYPNPVSQLLTVHFNDGQVENIDFRLFDVNGKMVISQIMNTSDKVKRTAVIPLSGINKGVYVFNISTGGKTLKRGKIIKTQ